MVTFCKENDTGLSLRTTRGGEEVTIVCENYDYEKLPQRIGSKNCQGVWGRGSGRPLDFLENFVYL